MGKNHWIAIALLLSALGMQINSLTQWSEALRPSFVAGFFTELSGMLLAIYSDGASIPTPITNLLMKFTK